MALVETVRDVARHAPLNRFMTPYGKQMSVRMTAAGRVGWVADQTGYRYSAFQPSGVPWPPIPQDILSIWTDITDLARAPDCCLINFYDENARMGLHQDKDEGNFDWPVVSISLGDDALFRVGTNDRRGPTRSVWLKSGDVVVLEGPSRLAYHGIDRLKPRSSTLLREGGRLNLTLRVVEDPI
ncbi:MAG: alpha-ketoglutarate-dependent dioxygenase AlkB [Rhodobacteraceae bacterium]|nr:alpha-ketoglutarate-dependent dioxygenase AlkB [Paracoccaceae bacterium]